jgi:hypothetical protein
VINGNGGDIDAANAMVGVAVLFQFALLLTSAILTCLWAKRIASNAKARGATSVSPGLAAGGWFIPIGNLFVGFDQLRKSVTGVGGKSPGLNLWQAAFVGQFIMGIFTFRGNDVNLIEPDALSTLRNQGLVALVGAVIYAAATFFAARAAKEIDTAVTGG